MEELNRKKVESLLKIFHSRSEIYNGFNFEDTFLL